MRLGLLGGTFDPIHRGHLDVAREASAALALDRVLFVPSHVPPHRAREPVASAFHRFAMTAMAVLEDDRWVASDLEVARPGPSFSVETLRALQRDGWQRSQLFFITGADAFAEVATWRAYPEVLDASHFAVVARSGYPWRELRQKLPDLTSRFAEADDAGTLARRLEGPETVIALVHATTTDVSSTLVRGRLAAGASIAGLVPPGVERHIARHRLYHAVSTAFRLHGQV